MARWASVAVERSTKAYPTGLVVRGLVGIEVDSLKHLSVLVKPAGGVELQYHRSSIIYLHKVALEKFAEIPLSRRVGEVPNVEATTLGNDGDYCLVLGSTGFVTIGIRGRVSDGGSSHGVGYLIYSRHGDCWLGLRLRCRKCLCGVCWSGGCGTCT